VAPSIYIFASPAGKGCAWEPNLPLDLDGHVLDHGIDEEPRAHLVDTPAGGISTARQALDWLVLIKEELGRRWLEPDLFRFGASSLLTDIERQLEHHLSGRYSANHRHAMA